jgi:isoleucyl-tRNA synthetase
MEEKNKSQSALREEAVLEYWKKNKIFEKSISKESPKGEYIFYEGPPTANGKPGIHHLEARAFKDVIPRYKTMCGYHVRRKGGWDTHGLPVELQVEKKLGLNSKKAIEDYGIDKFNEECKKSVWEYLEYWNKFTERIGFWLDQKDPYVTYHNKYIESVWNVIKEADNKKLLYKDYKVVPWCPRCGTALSSHELAQGYEDVKDLSVYTKFKIISSSDAFPQVLGRGGREPAPDHSEKHTGSDKEKSQDLSLVYILAWTTTPWTLPGNVALAVGENIDYVKIRINNEFYILAKARLSIIEEEYEVADEFKGKDLIGLEYEPLYPYLKNIISDEERKKINKAYKIYGADFVTTEDGTGVVHTAVMYGQDDFVLGTEIGLPKHHLVSLDGKFLPGTEFLEGKFVRDEETAVLIIKDLAHRNLLLKKEKYEHSYPHCWRCHTALIYYARDSWYIKMSSLRDEMIKENETINWEPSYIKEGRFGEWLKDIKDWAISRERYWGTPLPVWQCDKCQKIQVIGSIEDLKNKIQKSGNKYFVLRHGEAENNVIEDFSYKNDEIAKLTDNGINQVISQAKEFKEQINIIFSSPLLRTKQTTEIFCREINFPFSDVIYDERIREWKASEIFEGKTKNDFINYYQKDFRNNPFEVLPQGESFIDLVKRAGDFIYELEKKYQHTNILIVSHAGFSRALDFVVRGLDSETLKKELDYSYQKNAEIREFNFTPIPHNKNYEIDLHKPFIDQIKLKCQCEGNLVRAKEVMDVWLDSGAMPFAQDHYPFDFLSQKSGQVALDKPFGNKKLSYPADFISEAIDQTRGWFYTLHAVGAIMGRGKAYKNVICLGHILDAEGKKMSKSIGNVIDPWIMIDKYGVDTLRLWMYSVNQPGESKNFDERTVAEIHNKIFNLLYNIIAFYELYRDTSLESVPYKNSYKSNILDRWIVAKLNKLIIEVTKGLDNYKLIEPVRSIRDFIDELSTWYVRRSRERLKNGDIEAKITLYYVLKNLIKLIAPFAPFAAEDIWLKLKNENDEESVHLAKWPIKKEKSIIVNFILKKIKKDELDKTIEEMKKAREIVTLGLQARQKVGLPVRQPLLKLQITNYKLPIKYIEILKDELNVKEIENLKGEQPGVELDTNITPELKEERICREFIRVVQDFRKTTGLTPSDIITLVV